MTYSCKTILYLCRGDGSNAEELKICIGRYIHVGRLKCFLSTLQMLRPSKIIFVFFTIARKKVTKSAGRYLM
jgi:hypothetical protein